MATVIPNRLEVIAAVARVFGLDHLPITGMEFHGGDDGKPARVTVTYLIDAGQLADIVSRTGGGPEKGAS